MRTSTGGKCDFGASAALLTKASAMHFSEAFKRGSTIMLKLLELAGSASTLAEELSLCNASFDLLQWRPPCACESSCQFLRLPPWRDVAAELHLESLLNADFLCSSPCRRAFRGRSGLSIYRSSCSVLLQIFDHFLHRESTLPIFIVRNGAIALEDSLAYHP